MIIMIKNPILLLSVIVIEDAQTTEEGVTIMKRDTHHLMDTSLAVMVAHFLEEDMKKEEEVVIRLSKNDKTLSQRRL